ncbi:hypothetical protein HAZT_HAZT007398 [Hyalella azteca]|uniref:C2H2-type domain-containing protein n=1 Tax=Hyalella azteca TaxID=294128 RepID=A0A6A0HCL0_HYAAZ|nr:hypothetical protein HAZT_HAZT007398 [Hyalella azteca]
MEDNKVPTKDELSCDVCLRQFDRKSRLVAHYKTHTGERPFRCPYCSKSFASKGNCNTHDHKTSSLEDTFKDANNNRSTAGVNSANNIKEEFGQESPDSGCVTICPVQEDRKSFKLNVETALMALVGKSTISHLGHPNRNVEQVLVNLLDVVGMSPCADVRVDEDERLRVNMRKLLEYGLPEPSAWRSLGWHQEAIEAITAKIASWSITNAVHDNLSGRHAEIWKSDSDEARTARRMSVVSDRRETNRVTATRLLGDDQTGDEEIYEVQSSAV